MTMELGENPYFQVYRVGMPIAVLIASFVMIAELVPVPLQILSVKLRGKKLFSYTPIHHAFEKKGWPESRVVWTFALTQLLLSGFASFIFVRMLAATPGQGDIPRAPQTVTVER
jgi:UDP-N-acetylmuramyl pentapeptide phosphotransferase/UDP-N-acetylglucosamine-1-phosphate transferase